MPRRYAPAPGAARAGGPIKAFRTAAGFREWLARHHATENELVVKLYKVHAKQKGLTYVDGGDKDSFNIRFTPRKPNSTWSAVNVRKVKELGGNSSRRRRRGTGAHRSIG